MRTHRTTVIELLGYLKEAGLISEDSAVLANLRADAQRARLERNFSKARGRPMSGEISPAEIIASMARPVLERDRDDR